MDFKHQKLLSECGKRSLLRFCFRCEAGQPEEGDSEQRDGSGPCNHSLTLTHSCPYYCCCCCIEVITKPVRQYTKCLFVILNPHSISFHIIYSTGQSCDELPLLAFLQSCLCFSDCKQGSSVTRVVCWCVVVVVVSPGLFSLIRNSFHFRALMLAIKSTPQHYQSTEPPSTCKPIHLLPTLHPSPTSSLAEKIEDMP